MTLTPELPTPDSTALAYSKELLAQICAYIQKNGPISFADYMQMALYQPKLGYYSGGSRKFGASGDFITAPEISPLFSQTLARFCQQILTMLPQSAILEFGAGSGVMASEILKQLKLVDALPSHYFILELSADLKDRQQNLLRQQHPDYFSNIIWLDQLPQQPFNGVILANEVLDAMPIQRFCYEDNQFFEYFVDCQQNELQWLKKPLQGNSLFLQQLQLLQKNYFNDAPYVSEINLWLPQWFKSLYSILESGIALLIDYGFSRAEYYHPQRNEGTLMCHYRHRSHDNPLILTGIQDITAHVDFTWAAECAHDAGFTIAGFNTQANFLLECGIEDFFNQVSPENTVQQLKLSQQMQLLLFPHEMGELFKTLALSKNWNGTLLGFGKTDLRHRL